MTKPLTAIFAMALVLMLPTVAGAHRSEDPHHAPRERALEKYSAQWHACADENCDPGRNIRAQDMGSGRDAAARDIADSIRTLRNMRAPAPVVVAQAPVAQAPVETLQPQGTTAPPAPPAVEAPAPSGGGGSGLDAIAQCESGGDPGAVSPDGTYTGLFQMDDSTWSSVGGTGRAGDAPAAEQRQRAGQLQSQRGNQPWPTCG